MGAADTNYINPNILDMCVNKRNKKVNYKEHNAEHCEWIYHVDTGLKYKCEDDKEEGPPRMHHLLHNAEDAVCERSSQQWIETDIHGRSE